jgi:integrase
MNPIMGALRFFYGTTLDQKQFEQITFARKVRLPAVLTRDEVVAFLKAVGDLKMSTAFITIYAAGPRVSEVVARSAADIDSKGMVICVRQGKGRKDRYVMLALLQEMVAKLCLSMCTVTDLSRPAVGAVACRPARLLAPDVSAVWLFPGDHATYPPSVSRQLRRSHRSSPTPCSVHITVTADLHPQPCSTRRT